jgi:hypothetical protein
MINPKITAYVTKYALTDGIIKVYAEHCVSVSDKMIAFPAGAHSQNYIHGNDWHFTEGDALAKAEEMRQKKIASLKKQIARLEKLEFKI